MCNPLSSADLEAYKNVEQAIRKNWQAGDVISMRPWWASRIREYIGDLSFVQTRRIEDKDLSRYSRLWLVSLEDYDQELEGPFARAIIEEERSFGQLILRRYRLPQPENIVYDFRKQLHLARVEMKTKSGRQPCSRWIEDRWICSREEWNFIGRRIHELNDEPQEVIWAHPSDAGPIEIGFDNVPGGDSLVVRSGLTPLAVSNKHPGAPVLLEVIVNGQSLAKIIRNNVNGFFSRSLDISDLGPGPHEVAFRVSAKPAGWRIFCFNAEVRK
jgi:hypothetical protein